jgi:hypothetical protein
MELFANPFPAAVRGESWIESFETQLKESSTFFNKHV